MAILSIIIPAYNEENTVENLIMKVLNVDFGVPIEIIVVDDGSVDKTLAIVRKLSQKHHSLRVIKNIKNVGKSQTVVRGIKSSKGKYIVIQDADLEYNPEDLKIMLETIMTGKYDVVYGNRFGKRNKHIYLQNFLGNRFLSALSNVFTYSKLGTTIPDMEVCYKMMRGDIGRAVGSQIVSTSRFGLEPEITARLSKYSLHGKRLRFGIVPINYYPRRSEDGKHMRAFKHGFEAIVEIFRFNIGR